MALRVVVSALLLLGVVSLSLFGQGRVVTVVGTGLPASIAAPTSDQGKVLNFSFTLTGITCSNTDTIDHTITVRDDQSTPFYLYGNVTTGYTIKAGTTWQTTGQVRFGSGLKWKADSTQVKCSIVGGT